MSEQDVAQLGRPALTVTDEMRDQVEIAVACSMTQAEIARALGCDIKTLVFHFSDELYTGRDKKRYENWLLLMKNARDGNVSAQKFLSERMGIAAAGASFNEPDHELPTRPARLGKKEEAAIAATTAGVGTDWGNDLRPPSESAH